MLTSIWGPGPVPPYEEFDSSSSQQVQQPSPPTPSAPPVQVGVRAAVQAEGADGLITANEEARYSLTVSNFPFHQHFFILASCSTGLHQLTEFAAARRNHQSHNDHHNHHNHHRLLKSTLSVQTPSAPSTTLHLILRTPSQQTRMLLGQHTSTTPNVPHLPQLHPYRQHRQQHLTHQPALPSNSTAPSPSTPSSATQPRQTARGVERGT